MNGVCVPSEWSRQSAVWITWPTQPQWWSDCRTEAQAAFVNLAKKISELETLKINCASDCAEKLRRELDAAGLRADTFKIFAHDSNDVWCRDSGAIFRLHNGALEAVDFRYNSWGGKFPPWDLDDALAAKMATAANAKCVRVEDMVCEGGALEFDGNGTLLTTESVVLNSNRNPHLTKASAEKIFERVFGVKRVIWLKSGLFNDDTDGHIDNIARFAPDGKIIAAVCPPENPSYQSLQGNLEILRHVRRSDGSTFEIVELPLPNLPVEKREADGSVLRLPAGYANYLVLNGSVLIPSFGQPESDGRAREILDAIFKDRRAELIDSRIFIREGGTVHCLTQQQPEAR